MNLEVSVDFSEGDIFIINENEWKIEDIDNHTAEITWKKVGMEEKRITTADDIEGRIKRSGHFARIRKDYLDFF